jgi:hypothetical protein
MYTPYFTDSEITPSFDLVKYTQQIQSLKVHFTCVTYGPSVVTYDTLETFAIRTHWHYNTFATGILQRIIPRK